MKRAIFALVLGAAAISTGAFAEKTSPNAAALGPAPARGTGLSAGECIRSHDLRGHTVVDSKTMLLGSQRNATYRVTMAGSCLAGSNSSDPIITRNPPGSDLICKPIDLDLAISRAGGGFETKCIVDSIVKLSEAERAALPKKLRPN